MARNVEIKARVRDFAETSGRAQGLADRGIFEIDQRDVFFHARQGRLKLRNLSSGQAELIYYERSDETGPTTSDYVKVLGAEAAALEEALTRALGVRGEVRKSRKVFMVGRTRIHLDRVDGLGDYLELEVVLDEGEEAHEGEKVAMDLMRKLGVEPGDLVDGAYIDLLEEDLD